MNSLDCLIPARGGSKSIPKKNIYKLHNIPLIAYTIFIAKKCPLIKNVYVSTDSPEIAKIAEDYGAKVPFLRSEYLSTDNVADKEVFKDFIKKMDDQKINVTDNLVHLRATTPGREINIVNQAIKDFSKGANYTSLRSAHQSSDYPQKWFKKNNDIFMPLFDFGTNSDLHNMPRQSFDSSYIPNGYVDIVKTYEIKKNNFFHGNRIKAYITGKSIDIDSFEDFERAKFDPLVVELSKEIMPL